jgi:hypothetical protein
MTRVSILLARYVSRWRKQTPGWIKASKTGACKDSPVTVTLSIISQKILSLPELQTGKCRFAAQSVVLLQ